MYTRREWSKLALAAAGACATGATARGDGRINSTFGGVRIGAQSYSFRDLPFAAVIDAMRAIGIGVSELWSGHIEPEGLWRIASVDPKAREEVRRWRLSVSDNDLKKVRARFDRAGIELHAFNISIRDDFTEPEIERSFVIARALGAQVITSSSNVATVPRIDRYARKYKMPIGLHNHSDVNNANEFSDGASFARGLAGASAYMRVNLDVGHFTAANDDALAYLRDNHRRIVTLHIKDRKRNDGATVPFGEGDAPLGAVLRILSRNRWRIPANIEYEYAGTDAQSVMTEMRRCLEFCKREATRESVGVEKMKAEG